MNTAIVQNIVRSIFKSERRYDLLETIPVSAKAGKAETQLRISKLANKPLYRYSDAGKLANVIRMHSERENMLDEELDIINIDKPLYYKILADYMDNSEDMSANTFKEIISILEDISDKTGYCIREWTCISIHS